MLIFHLTVIYTDTDRQTDRQAGRRLVRSLTNNIRHVYMR